MTAQDFRMRCLLANLGLISAIPAVNYGSTHSTDEHPGGRKPPGDYGAAFYAALYGLPFSEPTPGHPGCGSDGEREQVIVQTQTELDHLRRGAHIDPAAMETTDATRTRMLDETEGWSLQDVARSSWRTSPTLMRKLRVADGRDAETGRTVELCDEDGLDLASRAKALRDSGMSRRQIALVLGVHKFQVERFLQRVA